MDQNTAQGVVVMMGAIYFAPAIIALARGHLSAGAIVVLNAVLGWTLLGWLLALVWSLTGNTRQNSRLMSGLPPPAKPLDWLVGYKPPQPRVRVIEVEPEPLRETPAQIAGQVLDNIFRGTHPDDIKRFIDASERPSRAPRQSPSSWTS